jgi:hypothetical protein
MQLFALCLKFRGPQGAVAAAYALVSPMNGTRNEDLVDERFVLDTLSMLVNVSLRCRDDQVSDVAHKLVFEILSSKAGPLHGQMLRMCSLLCTPSSTEFAKTVVDFMDRAYFSACDGSKSWLVQVTLTTSTYSIIFTFKSVANFAASVKPPSPSKPP